MRSADPQYNQPAAVASASSQISSGARPYSSELPPASPNRRGIVLIVAGLLATAAVSVAITGALVSNKDGDPTPRVSSSQVLPGPSPRVTATASSTRAPIGGGPYIAANVLDGSLTTAWVEGVSGPGVGEWIRLDFDLEVPLSRARITPGYFKSAKAWAHNNRVASATLHFSDGSSRSISFADQMEAQSFELGGIKTRWVRMTIENIYGGTVDSEDTPISEIAFDVKP